MPPKRKMCSVSSISDAKKCRELAQVNAEEVSTKKNIKSASKTKDARCISSKVYTHWLMKSEPDSRFENGIDMKFSIEDLKECPNQTSCWDGVRNYQARNFMNQMKVGQQAFFYHSNCKDPGIAGIMKIVKESYPDHTQFDEKNPHFDQTSTKDKPRWFMVDIKHERMLKRYIPLSELKALHRKHKEEGGPLENLALFNSARLSVQPVTQEEWDFIISLEN